MDRDTQPAKDLGRLWARPSAVRASAPGGLHRLELDPERESYLYVPPSHGSERPAPLVLMLHGAGGHAHHSLGALRPLADERGILLLAPASRDRTWDLVVEGYGPDVQLINQMLEQVFARYAVDPDRLALAGFSDGASYALSLGITNGDLFTHLIGFSPGFLVPAAQRGAPRVFISHGTRDSVLPIDHCSRKVVSQLRGARFDVRYDEFEGGHTVPPQIAREAMEWFLGEPAS